MKRNGCECDTLLQSSMRTINSNREMISIGMDLLINHVSFVCIYVFSC